MPLNEATADATHPSDTDGRVDPMDLFEQMLEAEIMGNGSYDADPDLELIEQRLVQLRQGSEPMPEPIEAPSPVGAQDEAQPAAPSPIQPPPDAAQPVAPALPPPVPPAPATPRPSAPPVVVADGRYGTPAKPARSSDAVVLEAARAAGMAPAYRPAAAGQKRQATPAPAPRPQQRQRRGLPSFYLAVVTLLVVSFALFLVWRPGIDDVIILSDEVAPRDEPPSTSAPVMSAIPTLPPIAAAPRATLDPQVTASVELPSNAMTATESPEFVTAATPSGYAARRMVKLYRVDARGNILGYTP
jgi:hypothetical protein